MKKTFMNFDSCYLQVVNITEDTDKVGIPYKTVQFQGIKLIGKREVMLKGLVTRVLWPATYERDVNGAKQTFRGDAEFDLIVVGDKFSGGIFHTNTTPYKIGEGQNSITSWKGVVFEGENPLMVAARALKQNNAAPLIEDEETGESVPFKLPSSKPVNQPHLENEPA